MNATFSKERGPNRSKKGAAEKEVIMGFHLTPHETQLSLSVFPQEFNLSLVASLPWKAIHCIRAHLGIWYLNHTKLCQGTSSPTGLKASQTDFDEYFPSCVRVHTTLSSSSGKGSKSGVSRVIALRGLSHLHCIAGKVLSQTY